MVDIEFTFEIEFKIPDNSNISYPASLQRSFSVKSDFPNSSTESKDYTISGNAGSGSLKIKKKKVSVA
ncbi:MAG: hypothetical protein Q8S21_01985 [Candidatus Paracaedibacteraceae bacterium]|nr:hypothetical protein [Candidatus Paracaedibacteraceae bacterium]